MFDSPSSEQSIVIVSTTDGFVFDISLNGINNYDEVSNGEDLYLYVIEVAELDGKTTSTVSNPTKLIGDEGNT